MVCVGRPRGDVKDPAAAEHVPHTLGHQGCVADWELGGDRVEIGVSH